MKGTAAFVAQSLATRATAPATKSLLVPAARTFAQSTALNGVAAKALHDCTKDAISYFTSVRTPATLIAGSALAALFSMVGKVKEFENKSRGQRMVLRLYYICCLFAYILSVTAVITSSTATTTLLLGYHNPLAESVYFFMNREMRFEFVVTRWAFFVGLMNFLFAVGGRMLIEYDLFSKERTVERNVVLLSFGGMMAHLISFVNTSLHCWPNVGTMTIDVFKLICDRAVRHRHPLAMIAMLSLSSSLGLMSWTMIREYLRHNKKPTETKA